LVQVKTSDETSKSGVEPEALPELITAIAELPHLALRGLMTIPAPTDDIRQQRLPFRALRETLVSLQHTQPSLDTLSMGMSGDLEAAIAEGATLIRVGTDIFGARYN
jgi:pyridoxal phosphate enzyme (YggS family)